MRHSLRRLIMAAALLCLANSHAFAQGSTTSSISGTVVDTGGGVIPGATVVVKNNATGTTVHGGDQHDRHVLRAGARSRHLQRHRLALRLQDRRAERRRG